MKSTTGKLLTAVLALAALAIQPAFAAESTGPSDYTDSHDDATRLDGEPGDASIDLGAARAAYTPTSGGRSSDEITFNLSGGIDYRADPDGTFDFSVIFDTTGDRQADYRIDATADVNEGTYDGTRVTGALYRYTGDRFRADWTPAGQVTCDMQLGYNRFYVVWTFTAIVPASCVNPTSLTLLSGILTAERNSGLWRDVTPNEAKAYASPADPSGKTVRDDRDTVRTASARSSQRACPDGRVPAGGFSDTRGTTHQAAIDCLAWWGITTGRTDGTYGPNDTVTGAQMTTFLTRLVNQTNTTVPPAERAYDYAHDPTCGSTSSAGVHRDAANRMRAYAGLFVPNHDVECNTSYADPLLRSDMAEWMAKAYQSRTAHRLAIADGNYFSDDEQGEFSHSALEHDIVATAGITTGTGQRTYGPARPVTRGQMATFLTRLLDTFIEHGYATPKT